MKLVCYTLNRRYDHNINYCHEMTPEEQEELSMFVESRKENAQGQGEVKSFKKKSKKVSCLKLFHFEIHNLYSSFINCLFKEGM